jgi:alcohol dehydrogenase (cytochrome c)
MNRRFCSRVLRSVAAGCLLLAMYADNGYGESEKVVEHAAANQSAPLSADGIGLINVTLRDLLPEQVRDNWVSYNGDYTGRRYSSLTQITPANVGHVAAQWVFHTREVSPLEVTPVVVAGIMFVTSANDAYALDAKTGKLLWHHARAITEGLIDDSARHHNRGVAILGTRLYMETDNAHLLCLDARSGGVIWDEQYVQATRITARPAHP